MIGRTCPLCEAMCGLSLQVRGERVVSVRGDRDDPFSAGYLCPKAMGIIDVHDDPDRLRHPVRRRGQDWQAIGWEDAFAEAGERLGRIRAAHGPDSLAVYEGNPTFHGYAAMLMLPELRQSLGTHNVFSTASVDHRPHMFAAYHMFGHQALLPVPDVDRTDFLLVLGANPAVSNGSLMSAPDVARRLRRLRDRGGRLVVVDPQRTRTARLADTHLAIRPGTDVYLLLALVETLFAADAVDLGRLGAFTDGVETLRRAVASFPATRVAPVVGLEAEAIRRLGLDFARARSAACYGRVGVCTQRYGGLCCWLMLALNVLTGNLDRVGGAMFTTPAVDITALASLLGQRGSAGRWRSRVRGLPEFGGELPLAALAEEIETPGPGQVRGLVTVAGNPVLSAPNGARLERALAGLDFMVAVDFYVNETTRHAQLVLPPTFALQRDHYDLVFNALAVRNVARYSAAAIPAGPEEHDDGEILLRLARSIYRARGGLGGRLGAGRCAALQWLTPRRLLDLALRVGPYGSLRHPFRGGLSLARLQAEPHTLDLGPLQPGRLPGQLYTSDRRLALAPAPFLQDLARAARALPETSRAAGAAGLLLIGRRLLRSNNSWMHNCERLRREAPACVLLMNPADACTRGLQNGQPASVRSAVGAIRAVVEITEAIAPGVVSLPHGFGHHRPGVRLRVAAQQAGISVNDVTDEHLLDELSATSVLNGLPVTVEAASA